VNAEFSSETRHVDGMKVRLDSSYVHDPFVKGWKERWVRNGWRRADGVDVLNRDLWERVWLPRWLGTSVLNGAKSRLTLASG